MAVSKTITQAKRDNFTTKLSLTDSEKLRDLAYKYYSGNLSQSDGARAWLMGQLATTAFFTTNDLWRKYFLATGITNQTSLTDMAVSYFSTATLP